MEMWQSILGDCEEQCNDEMMFLAVMDAAKKMDKEEWNEMVLQLKGDEK